MSSAGTISDAEVKALVAEIETVSLNDRVHLKPVLQALLKVIDKSADASPLLHKWRSQAESAVNINASETSVSVITELFHLGKEQWWDLVENDLVEVPLILKRNLRDLDDALYDEDSEATCRIPVDIMLVQCRKYLRNKYKSAEASHDTEANIADTTNPSTPVVNKLAVRPTQRVKLFPEASLSIKICDPFEPDRQILVTGRADWALGYSIDGDKGALLVAIEAKRASEFSKGEAQLIAYLAILRENRLQAKKTNIITQGFYSDGSRYAFISITADGTVNQSDIFNTHRENGLKMVFNFIIAMMETAMKSTPNASPTKPGQLQEKEIGQFESEVWLKVFRNVVKEMVVKDGDNMEDVIYFS